ncbi:MAG TPA: Wzz/FepE/Etk N-terminal domain-containing protein, partial [Candidatus Saccharimonadales bacterium]|nr:Wzz/FepE/Etk N-terminal domain-containing protein [Candidatus Saccharimonadales bacterium]
MNTSRKIEYQPGMTLGDIYFVIFRHKWIIIILALAGMAAAAAFYYLKPPLYQSQAELLIKYVPETRSYTVGNENANVIVPGSSGDDIINSEIQILTSLDLAEEV